MNLPLSISNQDTVSISDYFEFDTENIQSYSVVAQLMRQKYGVVPKEFKMALRDLENYPNLKGLPVAPLRSVDGSIKGLRFICLEKGKDIIIGQGEIIFNQAQLKLKTLLLTEDIQAAFKLSKTEYPVILMKRLTKENIVQIKNIFHDCCVITECHNQNNLKRSLSGLLIKVIGISEPVTPFTEVEFLEQEINTLITKTHIFKWSYPKKIKAELLPVRALNKAMLPYTLAEYVFDEANRADNMPPDFIAVCLLVAMCSVVGARVGMMPKKNDSWMIIPNLWGGIVAPPSSKKSPAFNAGTYPIDCLVREARNEYERQLQLYEISSLVNESKVKFLKDKLKEASKKGDENEQNIVASQLLELQQSNLCSPILKRFKTNDASPEALAELEKLNPNGVLVCRDELIGLLSSLDKNDNDSGRAFYLEGWNGNKSYEFDRIMRGTGFIENHCLSLLGGIQPDRLITYLEPSIKGVGNDGLLQRFQLLVYPDTHEWKYCDRHPNIEARNTVSRLFKSLNDLSHDDLIRLGAYPIDKYNSRPYFKFSEEAQELFAKWNIHLHDEIIINEEHPIIVQHLDKYTKLIPALALLFHLIDAVELGGIGPVSKRSLEMAIEWGNYLESHARRIYGLVLHSANMRAGTLCQRLKKLKKDDDWCIKGFSCRDVQRKNWKGLTSLDSVVEALEILVESNWLAPEDIQSTDKGGRPTKRYWINPQIYDLP